MQAQEVKQIEASVDDYIALLNQSGYQAYSFDISQLMDTTYYASFWFDEKYSIIRFCGAKEIDPDMSTEILKDTPHYYVIWSDLD